MFTMFKLVFCVLLVGISLVGRPSVAQNVTSRPDIGEAKLEGVPPNEKDMMAQLIQLLTTNSANGTSSKSQVPLAAQKLLPQASVPPSTVPAFERPKPSSSGGNLDMGGNIQSLLGQLLTSSVPSPSPANVPVVSSATKPPSNANNQEIQALLQQLLAKMSNSNHDMAASATDIVPIVAAAPIATASSGIGLGGLEGLMGQLFGVQPLTGMPGIPVGIVSDAPTTTVFGSGKSASAGIGMDTPFGSISKTATITANEDVMGKLRTVYAFLEKTILGLGTISAVIFFFAFLDVAFAEARGGLAKKKEWLREHTGGAANATEEIAAAVTNAINRNF